MSYNTDAMVIGVPKEIKTHEYRVALTPSGAKELKGAGNPVYVERSAGEGSGFSDSDYAEAGATLVERDKVFERAELIVKVKEPLPEEYGLFRSGHILFTYLHLAPNKKLTEAMLSSRLTALAYETLEEHGTLPLLVPMSEIAGRMSPLMGSFYLQRFFNGSGVLPSGASGVPPAKAVIIGAGVVGSNAVRVAHGLGMQVTLLNRGVEKLRHLDELYQGEISTVPSTETNIALAVSGADMVIGAVLITGEKTPMCVSEEMVASMRQGSVVIDVSIDQGGCIETSRPTLHDDPIYEVRGVIHYAVTNMPGAYPRTATLALTNSTLPYIKRLAEIGIKRAIKEDPALRSAVNIHEGRVMHGGLASSIGVQVGTI